jgi:hypothetical protein
MQKIRSATSIKKFTFFLTDDLPCLIEQYLALFGVKKSIAAAIFELKKNPRMEVCVWLFRRPPCGDFFLLENCGRYGFFYTALFLMTEP